MRIKQLFRMMDSIGWPFLIVSLLVIAGMLLQFLENLLTSGSTGQLSFIIVIVLSIHLFRKDGLFLMRLLKNRLHLSSYYVVEYLLVSLPVIVYFIYQEEYAFLLYLIGIVLLVCVLPSGVLGRLKNRRADLSFIPVASFELKITMARNWVFLLTLLCTAFLSMFHLAWYLCSTFLVMAILINGYVYNESLEILEWSKYFLIKKVLHDLGVIMAIVFFPSITALYFQSEHWLIIAYFLFYFLINFALAIVYKYSVIDGLSVRNTGFTFVLILMYFGLLPGLILATMIFVVYFYYKAQSNLKQLLC